MEYTKPELNIIGTAETLVLGPHKNGSEGNGSRANASFEFEE
jgi:hypothetical protein